VTSMLKGNFTPQKTVKAEEKKTEKLEDRFEREALKRLGGSIAFVKRKTVVWEEKE